MGHYIIKKIKIEFMNQAAPSVVIDAGTLNCKAGLANVDCP